MKSGTCFPSLHQKQGECRQDLLFPDSSSCRAEQGQHSRLTGCLLTVGFGVWQARKMLHFQGKCWRSLAPPWAPQASPIPTTGGVLGPGAVQGMGGFSGRYFQPSPTGLTAVIPEDRKICACFSAAAEQLRNVSHHGEPE